MKILLALLASLSLLSCVSPRITEKGPQDRVIQPRQTNPSKVSVPNLPPEKLFDAARKFFDQKDYTKSYEYFHAAALGWAGKTREPEALVWADRALFRGQRYHESIELSKTLLTTRRWNDQLASELTSYVFRSYEAIGDVMNALQFANEASKNPQIAKEADGYRLKVQEMIESKLNPSELELVGQDESLGESRAKAYLRLGEMSIDTRDLDGARKFFGKSYALYPNTDAGLKSQEYLNQLESLRRVEPKTIGAVLPMTGKYSSISQKTLRGIQMGLGLYNNMPSNFKLAVVDSEGNPDMARRGIERLVKEDNIIAVVGSLLSKTAPAVAAKTSELGVPSIALSQKAGITDAGPGVFRNSLTSEMQVKILVKTAMETYGMKKFAIMYPNDQYGVEFTNLFWDEVLARGGQIVGAQSYSSKETDFKDSVQRLVGTYYIEGRSEEYKLRLKEWTDAQKKITVRTTPPEDLLPPIVDFDAVFIPDNIKTMGQISAMLSFNGVKGVRLLGTNLWNVPGISKRAGHFTNNLLFVDSFFAQDPAYANSSFIRDYKNIFNEEPGIFEIQGYDAALLLRQLIAQGNTNRDSLSSALTKVKDFPGAVGYLSMTEEKEIMRPVVALTLDNSGQVIPVLKSKTP